jgi:hypothetical protein
MTTLAGTFVAAAVLVRAAEVPVAFTADAVPATAVAVSLAIAVSVR